MRQYAPRNIIRSRRKNDQVGVVGGTGYTGVELLRLLLRHPGVSIELITSRGEAGRRLDDLFPACAAFVISVLPILWRRITTVRCGVFATPHNVAMREVRNLLAQGVRVVDLSADFRLRDVAVWEQWYGERHAAPGLV